MSDMSDHDDRFMIHYGLNCTHLLRDPYEPADARCRLSIERYNDSRFTFLNVKTDVPVKIAARILGIDENALVAEAKQGKHEFFFPQQVSRRILLYDKMVPKWVTENEALRRLKISPDTLQNGINEGTIKSCYLDEFMHVYMYTKWKYEKCPLFSAGGVCLHFQPHDGRQIRCLLDSAERGTT